MREELKCSNCGSTNLDEIKVAGSGVIYICNDCNTQQDENKDKKN